MNRCGRSSAFGRFADCAESGTSEPRPVYKGTHTRSIRKNDDMARLSTPSSLLTIAVAATAALAACSTVAAGPATTHLAPTAPAPSVALPTCTDVVRDGPLPGWASDAGIDAARHVTSSDGLAVGVLWADPLVAGEPTTNRPNNKILWIVNRPRQGSELTVTARPAGRTAPTTTFTFPADSGPGEIYPSIIDLPAAGCWELQLEWAGHRAVMLVPYEAAPKPPSTTTGADSGTPGCRDDVPDRVETIGTVDLNADGRDEILTVTEADEAGLRRMTIWTLDETCALVPVMLDGAPATFPVGLTASAAAGISCKPTYVDDLYEIELTSNDGTTYEGRIVGYNLESSVLTEVSTDGAGYSADDVATIAVIACGDITYP